MVGAAGIPNRQFSAPLPSIGTIAIAHSPSSSYILPRDIDRRESIPAQAACPVQGAEGEATTSGVRDATSDDRTGAILRVEECARHRQA